MTEGKIFAAPQFFEVERGEKLIGEVGGGDERCRVIEGMSHDDINTQRGEQLGSLVGGVDVKRISASTQNDERVRKKSDDGGAKIFFVGAGHQVADESLMSTMDAVECAESEK